MLRQDAATGLDLVLRLRTGIGGALRHDALTRAEKRAGFSNNSGATTLVASGRPAAPPSSAGIRPPPSHHADHRLVLPVATLDGKGVLAFLRGAAGAGSLAKATFPAKDPNW